MSSKIIAHKYKLKKTLGEGSFGKVYLATNMSMQQDRAIKVIKLKNSNDNLELYSQNTETFNQSIVTHDNIVKINEVNIHQGQAKFLTIDMEIMENSLEDEIKNNISIKKAIEYIIQSLYGLKSLHNKKICHRDIKPANILISNNIAKLSDFGLSAVIGENLPKELQKQYRMHSAPEWHKDGVFSIQTDVYSIGITLYRCVNLKYNFVNDIKSLKDYNNIISKGSIISKLDFENYIPEKIKKIIKKSCNKDVNKRYKSAEEFKEQLNRISWNLCWKKDNDYEWSYIDRNEDKYKLLLESKKTKHTVYMKKNNRKNNNIIKEKEFDNIEDAKIYMDCEIARTMIK